MEAEAKCEAVRFRRRVGELAPQWNLDPAAAASKNSTQGSSLPVRRQNHARQELSLILWLNRDRKAAALPTRVAALRGVSVL